MKNPISRLLNHLTKDPAEQKNVMHWGGCSILRHASIPLYTGEIHQAWCFRLGLGTDQMAMLGLPVTIIHHIMMVFSCMLTNNLPNTIRKCASECKNLQKRQKQKSSRSPLRLLTIQMAKTKSKQKPRKSGVCSTANWTTRKNLVHHFKTARVR